jgi:hypothetical protein
MPLSTVAPVGFDANIAHTHDDFRQLNPPARRKRPDPTPEEESEPEGFHVVSEGAASTAGLSILAQALAAYSET